MNDDESEEEKDPGLAMWLQVWEPPEDTTRLDQRIKASYRSLARASVWTRLCWSRVSLPLPAAALLAVLLVATGVLAGRRLPGGVRPSVGARERASRAQEEGLANLRPLPEVRLTVLRQGADSDVKH